MQTFAERSPTGFADPAPYDPAADLSVGEAMRHWGGVLSRGGQSVLLAPIDAVRQAASLGEVYRAAERQQYLVETESARRASYEDWFDRAADRIKGATGESLDNPTLRNTSELAGRIGKGEFRGWNDPRIDQLLREREDAFLERARVIKGANPDKLGDLDLDTPIPTQAARAAAEADREAQKQGAREDVNPVLQLGAQLAGDIVGSRRDPSFWVSMLAPGGGRGASVAVRIGTAALAGAATNAAQVAFSQGEVQAWRRDAGLEHGADVAARNVGMAAAFGAIGGGALHGAGELAGAAARRIGGKASEAASPDPRVAAAEAPPLERAAQAFDEANRETLRAPPSVPEPVARESFAEALTHAETPDHPPPLATPSVPREMTDALARRALGEFTADVAAMSHGEKVDALRALDAGAGDPAARRRAAIVSDALDAEFYQRRAAQAHPELFDAWSRAQADVQTQKARLDEVIGARAIDRTPTSAEHVALAALSRARADADAFTGKRRSSPKAKAARERVAALAAEVERLRARADANDVIIASPGLSASEEAATRVRLNDAKMRVAALAPEVNKALAAARSPIAEAAALRPVDALRANVRTSPPRARPTTPVDAARALRDTPGATLSALASDDPVLRMAGRLATLDETALAAVEAGRVTPEQGAAIAGMADAPDRQAAAVALLEEQKPATVLEARQMLADAQAAAAALESAAARISGARPVPTAPQSLVQFLAAHGLADSADIRAIIGGRNHFVPGRGMLLRRRGGLTLDQALRAAEEAGYFFDPGAADGAGPRSLTPGDLIDAIDEEVNRGRKRYAMGDEPVAGVAELDPTAPTKRELQKAIKAVRASVPKDELDLYTPSQIERAAHYAHREGMAPGAALDRVITEEEADAIAFFNNQFSQDWRDGPDPRYGVAHEQDQSIPFDLGDAGGPAQGRGDGGGAGDVGGSDRGGAAAPDGRESAPAGGDQGVADPGVTPPDLLDRDIILFDDGTIRFGSADDAASPTREARRLSDVVSACKT